MKFKKKTTIRLKKEEKEFFYRNKEKIIEQLKEILEKENVDKKKIEQLRMQMVYDDLYDTICNLDLDLQIYEKLKEYTQKNNIKIADLIRYILRKQISS
ncbi:hypothetical protein N617_gp05 [Stygiolobus rod-shaped virus]|uniref:Uncharacterized protein n=1 Tax=Stygiolobus rod-shaped virus TaxID=537009 RepID=B6EFB1_9VIRU|nr:hypothetical protein N617_gp05 [Stygiolobus rod-shaped virus]CAQ58446.1 hypothetical protein [Stygiolobus rod-shaped virus]